jgi:Cys-tRNA(Pro)/Cys-tRNA(Cys) deacylase
VPADPTSSAVPGPAPSRRTPEEILRAAGVAFTVHEHEPVRTFAESLERLPFPAEAMVKTLAAETGGELVLVALRGADRLHFGKLARALGVGRDTLKAVTPAGLEVELGFEVGAVSLLTDFPAARLVDEAVLALGTVFTGSGRTDRTIEVAAADLVRVSGALPAELVGPPPPPAPPPPGDAPSQ